MTMYYIKRLLKLNEKPILAGNACDTARLRDGNGPEGAFICGVDVGMLP